MKIGIDTNVLIELFKKSENVNDLVEIGCCLYTYNKCLWEMVKYVRDLNLKDDYTERIVADFIDKNKIKVINMGIPKANAKVFEEKCLEKGIDCHSPDSEILLAFKEDGMDIIWSQDINLKKAAKLLGMEGV